MKYFLKSRRFSRKQHPRRRHLHLEHLERRELLTFVSIVAKDPIAGEEPQNGQTDPGQFVVTRDVVDANPLTVNLSIGGSAAMSSDYSSVPNFSWNSGMQLWLGTVTISAGSASAAIDVIPINDGTKESTETVTATVRSACCGGGGAYSVGSPSSDTITIADNDNWQVKVEANDPIAGEPSDSGQFTITRFGSGDTTHSLTVYFVIGGTATYATDYASIPNVNYIPGFGASGYVTIASGATSVTVNVNVTNDFVAESPETVALRLTTGCCGPGGNYSISAPSQATVTIADNDGSTSWQAKIETVAGTALEPTASGGTGTQGGFRVTRYGATNAGQAITVNYSVSGTATNGTDYQTLSGSVVIPANVMEAYIDVWPSYDGLGNDSSETVILALTSGSGYSVGTPSSAQVLIDDTWAGDASSYASTGALGGDGDGALRVVVPAAGLVWVSTDDPRPIVSVDVNLQPTCGQATLSTVEASLSLGGVQSGTVYYDGTGANGTDLYRFSLQVDASGLATGRHDWTITIVQRYSDQTSQTNTYKGQRNLVNRTASPFGRAWTFTWLDRLVQNSRGVVLVRGTGNTVFFGTSGTGQYTSEAGHPELGVLYGDWTNGFTLMYKDGGQQKFNAQGILTSVSDILGNTTTYSYIDADSDGQTDDPSQVVDSAERTTSFSYNSGMLSTITDSAGRVTSLAYTSGRLTSITEPDPDGAGPLTSPVWEFAYSGTTYLLESVADPADKTTAFDFDFARTLQTVTHPDETTDTLRAIQVQTLIDTSTGQGTQQNPADLFIAADVEGSRLNELQHELTYSTGPFGRITAVADPDGNVTSYEYNDLGLVIRTTQPDADGQGELAAPVTEYDYDSHGNLIGITFPDETTQSWTYNTTFNKPTSFTDELGRQTLYTLDPGTGNTLSARRVVGEVDSPQNEETDDLVTSYTYTVRPATSSDPPAGLVAAETDPLGRVTRYVYNAHGLVTSIVYAVGTVDQAMVQYQYNSADNLTAEVDELGRTTAYAYDSLNRRTSMTRPDPDGAGLLSAPVTTYEYDSLERLTCETDPLGRTTEYTYDDRGRVTQVSRPDHDGDEQRTNTSYTYTDAGEVHTVTDPLGRVTTYGYDILGRRTSFTLPDPDGGGPLNSPVVQYAYDNLGRLIAETDALGSVTNYEYNSRGWKTKMTQPDPDGEGPLSAPVWQYGYDAVGNMTNETDPLAHVTTRAYDALNRLVSITLPDPDGEGPLTSPVTEYGYDKAGNQMSVTDPLGRTSNFTFDNRNRQTQRTLPDPDGEGPLSAPVYWTTYDAAGEVVSETDPLGNVTSYQYDRLGRRTTMTEPDPDGVGSLSAPVWEYAYDAVGNRTSTTDPLDRVTDRVYDALDNLVEVTQPDPDGEGELTSPVTSYEYDAAGHLTSETDSLGHETSYAYDSLGRKVSTTEADPDGEGQLAAPVTVHTYDAVGNMLTLTDPVGNETAWTYDNLNRKISETNELSQSRSFEYDAAGRLTKRTDRNGRVIEYAYDYLGRQTAELWKDGQTSVRTISYAFDAANQLTSESDPAADYGFEYDELGRAVEITAEITGLTPIVTLTQDFEAAGHRTRAAFAIGTSNDLVNSYTFDNLGRVTRIDQSSPQSGNAVAAKRVDFAYDAANQWNTITRYANVAGTQLVATSTYAYDDASRLTELSHAKGVNTLASYTWTHDSSGRVTQFDSATDGKVDYAYDNNGQVTGADYDYQTDEAYSYDANGNRINTGYSAASDNRLNSDGVYAYLYDAEGNRTARFVDEDASGTLNAGDTDITEYTWDWRNRLTTVTERATYGGAATQVVELAYDASNRLVSESVDADGAGELESQPSYFVYDDNQIVLHFAGAAEADLIHRYLWGSAVDQILADEEVTSLNSPGGVLWPLTDNLGTVRDLATYDAQTDATTVANHRVYGAYGGLTSETNVAVDHLFGFTGRMFDEASGLQNNLNRWYDPAAGRWLSQDPVGFDGGDANLYRYVENRVTTLLDPTGLQSWTKDDVHYGLKEVTAKDVKWTKGWPSNTRGFEEQIVKSLNERLKLHVQDLYRPTVNWIPKPPPDLNDIHEFGPPTDGPSKDLPQIFYVWLVAAPRGSGRVTTIYVSPDRNPPPPNVVLFASGTVSATIRETHRLQKYIDTETVKQIFRDRLEDVIRKTKDYWDKINPISH